MTEHMTETDYLALTAGIVSVATAVIGLVRPTWVWGPLEGPNTLQGRQRTRRVVVTVAYVAVGMVLGLAATR